MNLKKVPDQTLEVFIDGDTEQVYLRIQNDMRLRTEGISAVTWMQATEDGEGLENVENEQMMEELDNAVGRGHEH